MAVNLSPIWGAGAQLLDNSGNVLTGGKIYTYAAGTTTPAATYTSSNGATANSNPIVLNSAGRVPYEIWLTDGISYKFVLKDSNDTLIATYDNLTGINSNFIAYTAQQEIQTATAGQTVFILTAMQYQPGTNNLSVFVDGVNQYGPGAQYAYIETSSDTVTFVSGLHVGASVKFTTATPVSTTPPVFSISLQDYDANGNGVTDTTGEVLAAESNVPVFAQQGTYLTSGIATPANLSGRQWGIGQIKTADGNKSAPNFSIVSSPPSSVGNPNSILTAFNGDMSYCQFPVSHSITGAATLGQPATGYTYTPEAMPHYTYLYNASGWNESTTSNEGRTGVAAYRTKVFQTGQGDAVCFNGSVFVTNTRSGSTDFLANPAGVLFNGDMSAGADGVYLNPYETICSDNGYDIACVGVVNNFVRTNATGAKSTVWMGYRAQNTGSATCDALISATGKWVTGLDLAMSSLNFGTNKAAISLKANDRIYLNNAANASGSLEAGWRTTVFNGDYIEYNSASSIINFVRGGSSKLQISSSQVTVANSVLGVNIGSGNTAYIRALQQGFELPTGTLSGGTFNTATVTLQQLAQYVAYLVTRIHASTSGAHALIGL